jgi:hypothetical protein
VAVPPPEAGVVSVPALVAVVELVELVVVVALVVAAPAALAVEVGTVNGGAPEVSDVAEPPPPQAETPTASAIPAANAVVVLSQWARAPVVLTAGTSGTKRFHTPAAMRTVVQVLLGELIAPVAEAEILHRPRQLGRRWRQRQQFGDHFEWLARLLIHV